MIDFEYGLPAADLPQCIDQEFDEIHSITGGGMPEFDLFDRFYWHDPIHTIAH